MQLQLQFIKTFNIHNTTTITIHEKHLIYTMKNKTFNIHNSTTITFHGKI